MKCAVCGKEIEEGARFCTGCGTPVPEVGAEPQQMPPNQAAWDQPPQYPGTEAKKKKSKIWIPFVIGGVVLLAGLFLVCLLFVVKPVLGKIFPKAGPDGEDIEEIIEDVLKAEELETTSFDLEYSLLENPDGYEDFTLSVPEETGYVNYRYQDFDGDGEEELFVVIFEGDGDENFFSLHMLEQTDKGEWFLADSLSEYEGYYLAGTSGIACPERCDIYLGEADASR